MRRKFLILVFLFLKRNKVRGRAKIIKFLSDLSKSFDFYSFRMKGYKTDIFLNLSDSPSVYYFISDGIPHEAGLLKILRYFSTPEGRFFDIGTNYGIYPYIFLNENLYNELHCFEPNPILNTYLNMSFKGYQDKIHLHDIGIGATSSTITFHYNPHASDLASFSELEEKNTKTVNVLVDTLDNIVNKIGRPNVMKIDVEGFEYQVLQGYKNLNSHYPIFTLEWIEHLQKVKFDELLKFFDATWHYFYIGHDGLLYTRKSNKCGHDILFISEENSNFFKVKNIIKG